MLTLDRYFERIDYFGTPRVDQATLVTLQRSHLRAIPYENFDIQLGVSVAMDENAAFSKLVLGRRGGWCYEMNGVLAWALRSLGFRLTAIAAGAMRETHGDRMLGNHLALVVHLEQDYLVDVGFGDGPDEPLPLREGEYCQNVLRYRLQRLEDGYWRFINHPDAAVRSFDFRVEPAETRVLCAQSAWLQSVPESPFVNNAVCFIHHKEGISLLRNRVFKRIDSGGVHEHSIGDLAEYRAQLAEVFNVSLAPEQSRALWAVFGRRCGP